MVPRRGTGYFRPTGRDGGLHPPFSFVLPKENAPCTVEEKNALAQILPCRSGLGKTGVERAGAPVIGQSPAGCA